jgi:hypothetical protein
MQLQCFTLRKVSEMVRTTKAQRQSIKRVFDRDATRNRMPAEATYRDFRKLVQPTFGCDGAVTVPWCGMWLCIEQDGYVHT